MDLFFTLLVEFGLPVASATVMGIFIYIILKYILDSVISQVNTMHGIIMGLDNRIKTMNNDILKIDVTDWWARREYDVVNRNGYLYDKFDHTDDWSDVTTIDLDVVYLYEFENLPSVFQRYITYRASRMAATQLVANPQLVQLLAQQESLSRAACLEYECNQGNHSMFGMPDDSTFTTYQPYRNLRR